MEHGPYDSPPTSAPTAPPEPPTEPPTPAGGTTGLTGPPEPPFTALDPPAERTPWWPPEPPLPPASRPPTSVPLPPPPPPPPYRPFLTPARRRVAGALAAVALVATSVGISRALDHNDTNTTTVSVATPAPSQVPTGTGSSSGSSGSSAEPAAAVADALLPSIVQLERGGGLGSGFIYSPDGYILTAAHVVEGADTVTVRLADGTKVDGRVVGTDADTDVGVVKIDRTGLKPAVLATGVPLRVGQLAVALGSPFGLSQTVTSGIVSSAHRAVSSGGGGVQDMIQTDAPINPGNSGGALADRQARVIGINSQIRSQSGGNEGVGFAVPIDTAAAVAERLVAGKPVLTGYLGISGTEPTSGQGGALVTEAQPGSPADNAGLRAGDLVTGADSRPVRSMTELAAVVRRLEPGKQLRLQVVRDGRTLTLTATVGRPPS